jgi:ribosomal protein S18 acetylase RimI-like enzyme
MDIAEFLLKVSSESDFNIVEHDLKTLGSEGEVTLVVKCQNGQEFMIVDADKPELFTFFSPFLDECYDWVYNRVDQFLAPQLKNILKKELDKNGLLTTDVFRKEKDNDITFTFTKTPEDDSQETTTYVGTVFENDLQVGYVKGYLIPSAYYSESTYDLMDGISNGCYRIWCNIYGRKNGVITPKLRKYLGFDEVFLVIDTLGVRRTHRGKGLGTKLMQKFIKEYCANTLTLVLAVNDEEDSSDFEQKLYSFYEKFGFKKLKVKDQVMYRVF